MSAPTEPGEWRKQLTSILIEAQPLVIIDNVTTTVDWGDLAKVITGEMHRDRLLGKSQTVSVPVRSWILTGNNLSAASTEGVPISPSGAELTTGALAVAFSHASLARGLYVFTFVIQWWRE